MILKYVLYIVIVLICDSKGDDTTAHETTAHENTAHDDETTTHEVVHETAHEHNRLKDSKHVHDKEHIKEHLKDVTDVKEESMSDEDLQFHYFKLHDYDNDNKLDGIELGNAMTHFHDEENPEQQGETYTDEQLSSMIDQILEEDDTNKDGYIDYTEFVGAQKKSDEVAASQEKAAEQ